VVYDGEQNFAQIDPWLSLPYVPFQPGQSRFYGLCPASRSVKQNVPVKHSVTQDSPTQRRSEAKCRPGPDNKVPPFPHLKFVYNNSKCIKINVNFVNTYLGPSYDTGIIYIK